MENPIIANVIRDGIPESFHTGIWALSDREGNILWSGGDIDRPVFFRSSIKLFQTLALIETGAAEAYGLTDAELAVICSSHNSEEIHVNTVRGILARAGLDESYLKCGYHPLYVSEVEHDLIRKGITLSNIYHNCSGKHAGILLLSKFIGADLDSYKEPDHPAQLLLRNAVLRMTEIPENELRMGHDGCDIPAFLVTPRIMAKAVAKWSSPGTISDKKLAEAVKSLTKAIIANPYLIAGKKRFCTFLATMAHGRAIGKVGSEAGYAVALINKGIGFACKANDGSYRGLYPFVGQVCKRLGVFAEADEEKLNDFLSPKIYNESNRVVGSVEVPEEVFGNFPDSGEL